MYNEINDMDYIGNNQDSINKDFFCNLNIVMQGAEDLIDYIKKNKFKIDIPKEVQLESVELFKLMHHIKAQVFEDID